jgi:hypothetical protein
LLYRSHKTQSLCLTRGVLRGFAGALLFLRFTTALATGQSYDVEPIPILDAKINQIHVLKIELEPEK